MQSKQYFTKIKNYPHEKSTEPIFCGQMYEPSKRKSGCNYHKTVNYSLI